MDRGRIGEGKKKNSTRIYLEKEEKGGVKLVSIRKEYGETEVKKEGIIGEWGMERGRIGLVKKTDSTRI